MRRPPKRSRLAKSDELIQSIAPLAARMAELNRMAVRQYTPIVEEILRTGSQDVQHIEWTLDGLLDFCCSDPALKLYRRLCRHYFAIDPAATALYIDVYRKMWDSDDEPAAPEMVSKPKANRISRPASSSRPKRSTSGTRIIR